MCSSGHNSSHYTNCGCRCKWCREDHTLVIRSRRDNRIEQTRRNGGVAVGAKFHNRSTYSNWGCRCDPCVDDWNGMQRDRNARKRAADV